MINWRVLLLCLMASLHLNLLADTWTDPKTNITWTYFVSGNSVEIMSGDPVLGLSGCSSQASSVIIPAQINSLPVTILGIYAFRNCPLSEVHIPASVNTINSAAFAGCNNLKEFIVDENNTTFCSLNGQLFTKDMTTLLFARNVQGEYKLPQGVTTIGYGAFLGCASLTSVIIPEGVTSIENYAFSECSSLTSVVIPTSVSSISGSTFSGCPSLTTVVIPEGVDSIKGWAFANCSSLISVVIPASVTSIERRAFEPSCVLHFLGRPPVFEETSFNFYLANYPAEYEMEYLLAFLKARNVQANRWKDPEADVTWLYTIRDNQAYIEKVSLQHPTDLIIPTTIDGITVVHINDEAFCECANLTSITIPDGVTSIGYRAFSGCSSLTSVVIPESVTFIGGAAFRNCSSLTSVVIPTSITTIEDNAFQGVAPERLVAAFVPSGMSTEKLTAVVIPANVTSIRNNAFQGCSLLTSIDIPQGVTSIGEWAFAGCESLTSVTIPQGVASIGDRAFSGCTSLTSLTIPKSVTYLGGNPSLSLNCKIIFLGYPPNGISSIRWNDHIEYPSAYAEEWEHALLLARRSGGYNTTATVSVRAEMTTPKTMKVTYKVNSPFSRAKVRVVAWKDGVRSFANIVPVKTAAEGSPDAVPNGEAVTTGVEHTFIWQVAADWSIDLAKVRVEVLAEDAGLLPQDLVTIPATETHAKMTFTVNTPTTAQLFNALVWYYAEGDSALTVSNGVVRINGTQVASGSSLSTSTTNATALLNYLYGKLDYKVLSGSDLSYAKSMTRLSLSNSGLTQLSVKISEE